MKTLIFVTAAFTSLATAALAAGPFTTVKTDKGDVLAAENGMSVYTFRNDKSGMSNCYDKCAQNWPPVMAASDAKPDGAYSLVTRKDGMKQWAKNGMPLYYWIKDKKKGDVTGDGFNGVWDVAKP